MRSVLFALLYGLLLKAPTLIAQPTPSRFTLSGYVRETGSGEALTGVNVYLPGTTTGTTTNAYGFFSLTLPAQDSLRLAFSLVGYQPTLRHLGGRKNQTLAVTLTPGQTLAEVDIKVGRTEEKISETPQMSRIDIPITQIKKIPAFLGEKDVLKVIQLMPGVQKGSEGQTGIYVRGGGPDQNLIILDEAVVYNANHLFGFFSVFNGDALRSVELTKGGFPARYGGRLSSVIELTMKEGNKEKLHGEGGIGLIASRLVLEGPLTKNKKASFLISARRTYLDVITAPIIRAGSGGTSSGGYYFYDLNAKANYDLNDHNKLFVSGYFGRDRFYSRDALAATKLENGLYWGNATGTLRWNHLFSPKLFANLSLTYSNYRFGVSSDEETTGAGQLDQRYSLRYSSGIRDLALKYDIDFYPNPAHSVRVGFQSTYHRFTPSALVLTDPRNNRLEDEVDKTDVLESGLYAEDTWRPTDRWRLNGGLRLSSLVHRNRQYLRPEPRLSVAYTLRPGLSVKASYALMNQYVHLLSNTGIGLPTDLWVPTTDRVRPQQSQQVALGIAHDFGGNTAFTRGLTLTVEGYYKTLRHIISYREGASFLLVDDPLNPKPSTDRKISWEDNVTAGRGESYGAEFLLQKKVGRFSGWTGYTLSWTQWQFAELNGGQPFFPRHDRRHDISLVGIYELRKRTTLSGTWVYGTGQALTLPRANYTALPNRTNRPNVYSTFFPVSSSFFDFGRVVQDYGPKNSFRAEPYHRFDLSLQFHKQKKRHERTWEFSVYNLYNRRNPFFYQLDSRTSSQSLPNGSTTYTTETKLRRYSVFPIVPSVSYNFSF
ncbi:TonB-dependent receptor [Spirosoma utsteinense]|uniref:TonB-dependent receptor n=1 Tax=Spirosoma utsteinense TaxID=2585773 RepID=A0ABR6WDM2_9BACT|nr:TonB-dependent receptor [Spirosoma utsteinense]MBC3788928.1 hypothetical protein [Spirosoma utsteinense]MBC3794654.1 hypothetical protein [Spirosoma utsteinense]